MKIKTIDINALEWFDRINGNSYFAGTVTVNYGTKTEKQFTMPFQYGYGSQYQQEALKILKENKLTDSTSISDLRDQGIILRSDKKENCKKAQLKEFKII